MTKKTTILGIGGAVLTAAGFYGATLVDDRMTTMGAGDDDTEFDCCLTDETCCIDLPAVCAGAQFSAIGRLDAFGPWSKSGDSASPLDFDKAAMTLSAGGGSPFAVTVVDSGTECGLNEVGGSHTLRIKLNAESLWEISHTEAAMNPGNGWGMWAAQ